MRDGAAFWNEHDTKVFCEMCKEEVDAGNRVDGYLSAEGYRNLQLKFNATTQRGYVKEHFKYRWNSLKHEYTRFRNGPPDNLSLLDELFGEDMEEATRVNIDGSTEDAKLTLSAMRKANLAKRKVSSPMVNVSTKEAKEDKNPLLLEYKKNNQEHAGFRNGPPDNLPLLDEIFGKVHVGKSPAIPGEDLGEGKQEATPVNFDGSDKDAEPAQSAMKKAKLSIPVEDLAEDKEVATRVNIDGPDTDVELTPSAIKKAKLSIPGEDLAEDKEMATPVNIVGQDKDADLTPSAIAKRKVSSPMDDVLTKEDKNPVPQKYKKACDASASAEVSSGDSNMVPTIREAVGLIRECGVSEGTALFYTATKTVAMNPEYRELFSLIPTREGRLDWLQRAHDDTTTRVHLCSGTSSSG